MAAALPAQAADNSESVYTLAPVLVTSSFREDTLQDTAASVSVLNEERLEQPGKDHLEDVLAQAPNVNLSAGASRGKFYQIRGVGERSQFIGVVNPSVGVVVDGIDMSAMAGGATLLDARQVEVLRGPQGSLYGANALAGLINIRASEPTKTTEGNAELTLGQYNTRNLSAAVGGPLTNKVGYRLAAQRNLSDGFITNDYHHTDNTNNIDETLLRSKFRIEASEDLDLDLSAFYANIDNGYDAFSLDNSRHTLSDQPGHDRQKTLALSGTASWYGHSAYTLQTSLAVNLSELEYGYDVDWANPGLGGYSATDNYQRDERGATADVRFISTEESALFDGRTAWTGGIYFFHRSSDLTRHYTYLPAGFTSEYEANRMATYGELETVLTDKLTLINGLRVEQDRTQYSDSDGNGSDPVDMLWGGRVALEYQVDDSQMYYALISRGYKVGGYNATGNLPNELRDFDAETLWNYEIGGKHSLLDDTLHTQVALFFQQRDDAQISAYRNVLRPDNSTDYIDYTANAERAYSYGLEAQAQWQASAALEIYGSLGLLDTRLEEAGAYFDGRDAAHAPEYQFALGASLDLGSGWFTGLDVEGKDTFYFSDSHDARSDAYALLHARFGYQRDHWSITLWGRNLTDEDYAVRGFQFGNDPRKGYVTEDYIQLGAPRLFGVTTRLMF
ncbi:TonB-dependent receptor [Oceanimonas sp. GK1]|uniref:TonB-dependent receptor n=1 Tax=Oceanimonas sp. (strain GK1 / IBRC-M 10197) TaxID=511062 RepID=UPI00024952FD|nr:TonB-dependent receptor plug domain-containing protein [Oceanimonas sp. GK1]AEY01911.1 TonB-dependent receptor [Oceanimonas sp. GK1]